MIDVAFAVPGDLYAATGGYAYARKVFQLLPESGVTAHHLELPGAFPDPTDDDLATTRRLLDQIHPSTPVLFDGLACGALPLDFLEGLEPSIIALVHHPLALETGLEPARAEELMTRERASLSKASAVVATSAFTGRLLVTDFSVPPEHLTIAEPGTEPAERSRGTGRPFTMLAVGSLIPRKGYSVLIDALRKIGGEDWQLTIVGSPDHDPNEANRIREHIMASGLRSRITVAGKVGAQELKRLYARTDLFVMPSLYEGYGMVLAEAMACGLPIVCTTGGAAAETVPEPAASKVPPNDPQALADAIALVKGDEALRSAMQSASWDAGSHLPRWSESIEKIAGVIKTVYAANKEPIL